MVLRRLVPDVIRRSYALKFGIALFLIVAAVGTIGVVATAEVQTEVQSLVNDDQATLAHQEAERIASWHETNEQRVSTMASVTDPETVDREFLSQFTEGSPRTHSVHVADVEEERIVASAGVSYADDDIETLDLPNGTVETVRENPEFRYTTGPYRSDLITTRSENPEPVIAYILPIDGGPETIVYVVYLDQLSETIHSHEESGSTTLILDGQNRVMVDDANFGEEDEGLSTATWPLFLSEYDATDAPARAREQGEIAFGGASAVQGTLLSEYGFPDEDYVVGAAPVEGTDWVVTVHTPEEQAYGFVTAIRTWGLVATLGGVLFIGLVGAVLGRNTARSIDRLTEKAGRMEEGDLNVDFETERVDNIGRLYDGFASMQAQLREQIEEVEQAREEAERERERVEAINEELQTAAREYRDVMGEAADGDLTVRASTDADNETMRTIGEDFNAMLAEIETTVARVASFAREVATASEQVTASSEEVRGASEQVAESVQEISDGAQRQNESLQQVDREMEGLSTTTEEIAASSNEVADIAERTASTGQRGRNAAGAAIQSVEETAEEAEEAVEAMRDLEEEVGQVDELIERIAEIAEQTNMLALNANIEASRSSAGDEGGFGAVAQEVKDLSEDARSAADEIERRLERIREQTAASAEEVESTRETLEETSDQVREAVDALEEIAEYAEETNQGVQEISAATEQQAASTQEVVAMVDEAATISEETTAEAESVAAAAEEQTTALTEVSQSASDLSEGAAELSEALDRFETDVDAGEDELPEGIEDTVDQFTPDQDADEWEPEGAASGPVSDEPEFADADGPTAADDPQSED